MNQSEVFDLKALICLVGALVADGGWDAWFLVLLGVGYWVASVRSERRGVRQ